MNDRAGMPTPSEISAGGFAPLRRPFGQSPTVRLDDLGRDALGLRLAAVPTSVRPANGPGLPPPRDSDGTVEECSPRMPLDAEREMEADRALCRSALYEAVALGCRPPTPETTARLASREGAGALADAAGILDDAWGSTLAAATRQLAQPLTLEALTADFHHLFGHTARGPVPPYETEYGADSVFQPMDEMSDLVAFYRAFGLRLRPGAHERPDHLSCECEFLAFLARKEAYALGREDRAMLDATRQAGRRFLRDHLGRWAPAFGRTLARHDADGFFGALGVLCTDFVTRECARVGIPAGPEWLRLRSTALPPVPAACDPPESAPVDSGGP